MGISFIYYYLIKFDLEVKTKQENTELGSLMHDLHYKNTSEIHNKILAERVYELKETQKGILCDVKWKSSIMMEWNLTS